MKKPLLFTFASAALLLAGQAAPADIYVITSPNLTLKASDVKDVFKGDKLTAGGIKLVLADNKAAMAEFLEKVLKIDSNKYHWTWAKKIFREGIDTPVIKKSNEEVIEFVKSNPGGVGYVSAIPGPGVKLIEKY